MKIHYWDRSNKMLDDRLCNQGNLRGNVTNRRKKVTCKKCLALMKR